MIVRTLTGVVKDGVIVPDVPLHDGVYVEITASNASREIAERVRHDRDAPSISKEVEGIPVTFGPFAEDLIEYNEGEDEFVRVIRHAKECFPELLRVSVTEREAFEVLGWFSIEVEFFLPAGITEERLRQQELEFHGYYPRMAPLELKELFLIQFRTPPE